MSNWKMQSHLITILVGFGAIDVKSKPMRHLLLLESQLEQTIFFYSSMFIIYRILIDYHISFAVPT